MSFARLPLALQRRTLQLQLLDLGVAPEFEIVDRLRTEPDRPICLKQSETVAKQKKGVPFSVRRDVRGLVHREVSRAVKFSKEKLKIALGGAKGEATFAGVRIRWSKGARRGLSGLIRGKPGRERFDAELVGSPILLRHWRPGDRFQPSGMTQPVKLQDLFTNARISRAERHQLLVAATSRGQIFWVERLRISERFKLTQQTIRCLHWHWQRF